MELFSKIFNDWEPLFSQKGSIVDIRVGSTYVSDLFSLIFAANSSSKQIFFPVNISLHTVLELLRYIFKKQVLIKITINYSIRFYLITVNAFLQAAIFDKF